MKQQLAALPVCHGILPGDGKSGMREYFRNCHYALAAPQF